MDPRTLLFWLVVVSAVAIAAAWLASQQAM